MEIVHNYLINYLGDVYMRKMLHFFIVIFLFCAVSVIAQDAAFNTGKIGAYVGEYGRIRLFTPDTGGVKHIERISVLVGMNNESVFDYQNDADVEVATALNPSPAKSDYEINGTFNNAYSSAPPNVLEKLTVMGWNEGGFVVIKFTITSNEVEPFGAITGLDIIPILDGEYGFDTVTYNPNNNIIRLHRGATNVGYKLLSGNLVSLKSFEWFSGYEEDTNYWNWLNAGSIEERYVSETADGPVIVTSHAPKTLAKRGTTTFYYAVAIGANETELLQNMAEAEAKYLTITDVEENSNSVVTDFALLQNYPNPFNPSTTIVYQIPEQSNVSLKVFDVLGKEVAVLVKENQAAGIHNFQLSSDNYQLPSGIYFYQIKAGNFLSTKKMTLLK